MDPYKILGVDKDATKEEIRRAYREKAKKYHPDRGGDVWAFQQVVEAHDILTGKIKRPKESKPKPNRAPEKSPSGQPQTEKRPEEPGTPPKSESFAFNDSKSKTSGTNFKSSNKKKARSASRGRRGDKMFVHVVGAIGGGIAALFLILAVIALRSAPPKLESEIAASNSSAINSIRSETPSPTPSKDPDLQLHDDGKAPNRPEDSPGSDPPTLGPAEPSALVFPTNSESIAKARAAWAQYQKVEPEIKNNLGMQLILIPPGQFEMGSPEDDGMRYPTERLHRVSLSAPFFLGTTEVTQAQWKAVMATEPWKLGAKVEAGDDQPASLISWNDAVDFCKRLSGRESRRFRLPTEAEWEYASRGGSTRRFSFGDDERLEEYGWYSKNSFGFAHPVSLRKPNAFGLFDMQGNVREWCFDLHGDYSEREGFDPIGADTGAACVIRGGSFVDEARACRPACRNADSPNKRNPYVGFRVVAEIVESGISLERRGPAGTQDSSIAESNLPDTIYEDDELGSQNADTPPPPQAKKLLVSDAVAELTQSIAELEDEPNEIKKGKEYEALAKNIERRLSDNKLKLIFKIESFHEKPQDPGTLVVEMGECETDVGAGVMIQAPTTVEISKSKLPVAPERISVPKFRVEISGVPVCDLVEKNNRPEVTRTTIIFFRDENQNSKYDLTVALKKPKVRIFEQK